MLTCNTFLNVIVNRYLDEPWSERRYDCEKDTKGNGDVYAPFIRRGIMKDSSQGSEIKNLPLFYFIRHRKAKIIRVSRI